MQSELQKLKEKLLLTPVGCWQAQGWRLVCHDASAEHCETMSAVASRPAERLAQLPWDQMSCLACAPAACSSCLPRSDPAETANTCARLSGCLNLLLSRLPHDAAAHLRLTRSAGGVSADKLVFEHELFECRPEYQRASSGKISRLVKKLRHVPKILHACPRDCKQFSTKQSSKFWKGSRG